MEYYSATLGAWQAAAVTIVSEGEVSIQYEPLLHNTWTIFQQDGPNHLGS